MTRKTTTAKRQKAKPRRASTDLVKAKPQKTKTQKARSLLKQWTAEDAKLPTSVGERSLGDDIMLGNYGCVEMRLTDEEEKALADPFNIEDVRIKPDGSVYLPHIRYTEKLNRAFGRLGWQMVPASKPQIGHGTVVVPYRLHVHGKPIAFGFGEQEYFDNNANQSYGDAIEATMASGLRRVCKHLGVALELWDSSFGEVYKSEHAVNVKVDAKQKDGTTKTKYQWRRRCDPPFWNEQRSGGRDFVETEHHQMRETRTERPASPVTTVHHSSHSGKVSEPQLRRLWAIARNMGRSKAQVDDYLRRNFKVEASSDIQKRDYEAICSDIESPNLLEDITRG